jgi:hypothetical protein
MLRTLFCFDTRFTSNKLHSLHSAAGVFVREHGFTSQFFGKSGD